MKRLLAALCALAWPALAADAAKTFSYAIRPGGIEEECVRLDKGDTRDFRWTSDAPVDFNIHYHRGNDVLFPVKGDGVRAGNGTFTADSDEHYCWMWTALDKPAKVEGSISPPRT
jgi:hypothetical protein